MATNSFLNSYGRFLTLIPSSPPVARTASINNLPSLVYGLNYLLWQWSFLQVCDISLQLLLTANTKDDTVVAPVTRHVQLRVVDAPSQCGFDECQVVFLGHWLDDLQRFKGRAFEVALAIHFAYSRGRV